MMPPDDKICSAKGATSTSKGSNLQRQEFLTPGNTRYIAVNMEELQPEREIFGEVTAWRTAERHTSAVSGPFCFQTCIYDACLKIFLS